MATEVITAGIGERHSDLAIAEEIHRAFSSHREELKWLAGFLTGENELADACVIDASVTAAAQTAVYQAQLSRGLRLATISSAFEIQQLRIAQLAAVYEVRDCVRREYRQLPLDALEFLVQESDLIQSRLDALCRFALIVCGVETRSSPEAAQLLGISRSAVEAAYSAALESLDIMRCQVLLESYGCGACN